MSKLFAAGFLPKHVKSVHDFSARKFISLFTIRMPHFLLKNYAVSIDFMGFKLENRRKIVLISEAEYSRMGNVPGAWMAFGEKGE